MRLIQPNFKGRMKPNEDPLYRVHQFQAARRGRPPLEYYEFRRNVGGQSDTDLTHAFFPEHRARPEPLFELGAIYATSAAMATVPWDEIMMGLAFHERGQWGEVSPKQWLANDLAVANRERVCSAHLNRFGVTFWVITDIERRRTTIVMPEETRVPGGITHRRII